LPQGVEAELKELRAELAEQKRVAAQEKLDAEIMRSATALGVDPSRVKYLKMELRESHGKDLTHEGTPDAMDPSKCISVETIIAGILRSPAGAMFKAAPSAASLPIANANQKVDSTRKISRADFDAIAKKRGQAYTDTLAALKAGQLSIVDKE
jgi:hypothetical protein